jgi:hypothetical protein
MGSPLWRGGSRRCISRSPRWSHQIKPPPRVLEEEEEEPTGVLEEKEESLGVEEE